MDLPQNGLHLKMSCTQWIINLPIKLWLNNIDAKFCFTLLGGGGGFLFF